MAHVSENKKQTVAEMVQLLDSYPVIGVVNMTNLPARQLQKMRTQLRKKEAVLRMTKKRLMKIAFKQTKKKDITALEPHLSGMPALIFTKDNPFKIYKELQKTKSKAPAKAGQTAPKDISVKAGPTPFAPGPIIGQLGQFGIKTGVEAGKIVIKDDKVVAHKGDVINAELAGILTRLGIEPMEIGLDLTAAYENGTVFSSDVLYVDEAEYRNKICAAYYDSLNLAVYAAYPTGETISRLLAKAHNDSKSLAVSQMILTSETTADIVKKAYAQMRSLSNSLPDEALGEELKSSRPVEAAKPQEHKPQAPKEEKPPEDAAAGLGSLFG